ncbi:MAG: hypothetical protein HY922_08580 [Elusimicrobia bacterium]|nr:hypothetical protein [Elusimicrobiota bacterium]
MDIINANISSQLDSIDNLDTAKMTLRWALERLRSLEARNSELQKRYEESRAALLARQTMKDRGEAYAAERESYYAKIEELLCEFTQGTLDLKKLLSRENEIELKEKSLRSRQDEIEKEYALRLEILERDFKKLQAETELRGRSESEKAGRSLEESRTQMDKAYISKEVALRALERHLDAREKAQAEREQRLEGQIVRHREENERELQHLRQDLLEEHRRQVAAWERDSADMQARREKAVFAEKTHLLSQLGRWEEQAKQYLEKISALESERVELNQANLQGSLEFEKKARGLEDECSRLKCELDVQRKLFGESLGRRREELSQLEHVLVRRFSELDEVESAREAAWRAHEESLRQRNKDWHGRMFEAQEASLEKSTQIEALKQELLETIHSYHQKLIGLENPKPEGPETRP